MVSCYTSPIPGVHIGPVLRQASALACKGTVCRPIGERKNNVKVPCMKAVEFTAMWNPAVMGRVVVFKNHFQKFQYMITAADIRMHGQHVRSLHSFECFLVDLFIIFRYNWHSFIAVVIACYCIPPVLNRQPWHKLRAGSIQEWKAGLICNHHPWYTV